MMQLDHLAVAGETLAEACKHVEQSLGVKMQPGGRHAVFHTHNALLGLEGGLYLEAIAIDPSAPQPQRPRWFDLDRFEGPARLTNWICRSEDMERTLADLPKGLGAPVALSRGDLRWRMAVPGSGLLPYDNCAPALIQWETPTHPATLLVPSEVRLMRLTIRHPEAEAIKASFEPFLSDDRISYEVGPVGLLADFDTPHGPRVLGG
ncbi:VOC family protein [uncultured Roseobacter sp.]|uniref:VOC family protein n=1 Tax=uncultured Roseobacter sp. TaxID=114847 RepID=UPI00260D26A0|nr:VOC family protein [uncultured Roseobacter sp.]